MKLIWLTDIHFGVSAATIHGIDPNVRLQLAIDEINQLHGDASFCVISGDLIDNPEEEDYLALKVVLDQLTVPVLPLIGNHDQRTGLLDAFRPPVEPGFPFVQYLVETAVGNLLCLDTHVENESRGLLCTDRLEWLERQLIAARDQPTYIFMHHPPIALHLGPLDELRLINGDQFVQILHEFPQVQHIFAGHVHRPISASIAHIHLSIMSSTLYQAPLPNPPWDWSTFTPAHEAPMYGIIHIEDGAAVVHYRQFCQYLTGSANNENR